ncbi:hypothetical protein GS429_08025 [Natronorubrum sp. JWXQ-INN-674]|uniref:DUF7847 domain-containing protein n=1 Tax=Natronorubrum halalkaliphilum TaxID=2691917 RepID=A0A6B0VLW3_9EURY|nr:hypothetical protein [Natronorubrum halalkaliphilum]MXV62006.1 hypothetical protein [Natronorubrum halalkaliphilum]
MVFHIIDAMTDGFDRTRERNGLLFVAAFAVLALLGAFVTPTNLGPTTGTAPTLGLIDVVTGLLSIAISIATLVAAIVALRTFASDERETIPREFLRHNIGLATLNAFVGSVVFVLLVVAGSALLLVPGLFVLVTLYYWSVFVAVEDQNFVAAFRSSWELTKGSRIRLFGLGVAVIAIGLAVTAVVGLPALLIGGAIGVALTQIGTAIVTVYTIATTARAYDQLTALEHPPETEPQPGVAGTPA